MDESLKREYELLTWDHDLHVFFFTKHKLIVSGEEYNKGKYINKFKLIQSVVLRSNYMKWKE